MQPLTLLQDSKVNIELEHIVVCNYNNTTFMKLLIVFYVSESGLISWLFLPAIAAGMYFDAPVKNNAHNLTTLTS